MKKDLILITAFCDTDRKLNTIRKLINNIKTFGNEHFDVLVSSHSILPQDIVSKVDYFFYDSKNILLEEFDKRASAWFHPIDGENEAIHSIFVGNVSTHLAIWRLLIFGNNIAKSLGYNKIHQIEYDTEIEDIQELLENSKLLDTYDVVTYKIKDDRHHDGLLLGSYQSYRLDTLSEKLTKYDEDDILNTLKNSEVKSCEVIYKNVLHTNKKFLEKNIFNFKLNGMRFAISKIGKETPPEKISWCIPYYERKTNKLKFLIWNSEFIENLKIKIIYNNSKIYNITDIGPNTWRIIELGDYDSSNELVVIVNNKIRNIYDFTQIKDIFKLYSFR